MKSRPGPARPAALCCRLPSVAAALLLLLAGAAPAWAATMGGAASATVVEPAEVNRLLGLPASALELYLRQQGPGGPQTGSVLIRLIGGIGDEPLAVQLPQAVPVEAQGYGPGELAGGTTILGRGLAMAVMASMSSSEEQARENNKPVAITIAFN